MKKNILNNALIAFTVSLLSINFTYATGNDEISLKDIELSFGMEKMSGDTTYEIGYPYTDYEGKHEGYFPFSRLAWPLDINLLTVGAHANLGSSFRLLASVKKNMSKTSDKMVDKDWVTDTNPHQLDIYSSSNISDFTAFIFNLETQWFFVQNQSFNFYTGLKYEHQKFKYSGKLIHQYSPSGLAETDAYGDGSVGITYEITHDLFYLMLGGEYHVTPNFTVVGSFGFDPSVSAKDKDVHILRDKISKANMDGSAYIFDLSGQYDFTSYVSLKAGFHYTHIKVEGNQKQSLYGIPMGFVSEESKSTQSSACMSIIYKF